MISTPQNIAIWGYELFSPNGEAVSATVRQQLVDSFRDSVEMAGGPWLYGYHTAKKQHLLSDGTVYDAYGHPGGGSGATSALFYVPLVDLAVALQANTEDIFAQGTCITSAEPWLTPFDCVTRDVVNAVNNQ